MSVASTFANRVYCSTATVGTGTLTLGAAKSNAYLSPAEGLVNGKTYSYLIEEGTDFEIGTGLYTSSGTTLTRATVNKSKIGGVAGTTKMTLAGAATVRIIAGADDVQGLFDGLGSGNRLLGIQQFSASGTYTPTAGAKAALVLACGPGAGAGGINTTGAAANTLIRSGHGSAGELRAYVLAISVSSYTITIGTGGAGGAAGANNGVDPTNDTKLNDGTTDLLVAKKGNHGTSSSGAANGTDGADATGGTGGISLSSLVVPAAFLANNDGTINHSQFNILFGAINPSYFPFTFNTNALVSANANFDAGKNGNGRGSGGMAAYHMGANATTSKKGGDGTDGFMLIIEFG